MMAVKSLITAQRDTRQPLHLLMREPARLVIALLEEQIKYNFIYTATNESTSIYSRSTPVAQLAPRNLLTRWDVSSIPANGIFLTKN